MPQKLVSSDSDMNAGRVSENSLETSMLTEAPTVVPAMVLWGQWFSEFKTPLGFNFVIDGEQKAGLKIRQMKSSLKFCIILAEDGRIYSIGKSNEGALGIQGVTDSKKKGMLVNVPG